MGSPERTRSSVKRDTEDNNLDLKSDRARDKEESEGGDKRKHRSSRSKRSGNGEEAEGVESRGRKRSSGDRNENRKRSSGSSKTGSDEDDYEVKKESRSKMKKKQEESALDKLSNWYQDGEAENKSGNKGHVQNVEKERVKSNSKLSDHESSQTRSKGKDERSHGRELAQERDFTRSERRESSREKGQERDSRSVRRESSREKRHGSSDPKHETSKERSLTPKTEPTESKIRVLDSNSAKCTKSRGKEERMVGSEKSKARSEAPEEGKKETPLIHEYILGKEKLEEQRLQASHVGLDVPENRERPLNTERSNRSGSPERSGRRHHESEYFEMDYERSSNFRRDDRFKGRDDSWSDRNRDREDSRDNWKRRQPNFPNKDAKDVDTVYDHGRDWELQRRGRERFDNERPQGRLGGRRDGNRTEVLKTSFESNYGISNDNYDVIEIQTNQEEHAYPRDNRAINFDSYGSWGQSGEDSKDRFIDDRSDSRDQNSWRDEKARSQKGATPNRATGGPSSSSGSQTPHGNQEVGPFNRGGPPGNRGNRFGRGGRGRHAGRDSQPVAMPMPMVASPFGPLGMPPLTPTMSPGPGPPISPGVFIPPFPPVVWPGPRSVDMNLLAVQPGISTVPPGPSGPCFSPNIGTPSNPAMFFNQPGLGRGGPPNISGPSFNAMIPLPPGRGQPQEKTTGGGWVPPRSGPHGKAPSRGEQNDYSQNFVDTGMRPQNYIRELELTNVVEDYPKLRELIQRKDEIVTKASTAPMYYKCDLREHMLSSEFFGTKFDVILVDPPWEEYVHRAPGVTDHMEYWTFEEIMNLKIEAIADTPSFIFLWVGDGVGLEQGRQCLKKWGFRRCEDICWVKTNKTTATPGLRHDSRTLFQRSKEHCLMGIKGTVRRSTDGHIIHANIDTDVIIAEEPPYGSTAKPEDMYRIVEHFCLGRRRLELFGEDHNIRAGWLTVGKDLSSSNFNSEAYIRDFSDKDGKVWQGGGGRNPPPEAGHLILTTPEIESLRPKSPMKNQQQMQQQQQSSTIIAVTTTNSATKWAGNSPAPNMNQEASSSNNSIQFPWASSQMEGFKGVNNMGSDDRAFDMYGYNVPPFSQAGGDYLDYESHRVMNNNNNNNNMS